MRYLRLLPLFFTAGLIYFLNHYWSATLPALGRILDPFNGAMAAAERADKSYNLNLKIKGLNAPTDIWLEDNLVPHIRAQNNHDLYLAQGYIHAYFRLWQMDLQTRSAAGRLSEIIGPKTIEIDRGQRRKGMVWGAKKSLAAINADPRTKEMVDAYTTGINAYISTLNYREWPLEYKIIGHTPEDWTPLKTALMMKAMADDLSGKTDDIAYTILRDKLGQEQFDFLFPEKIKGSKPAIPEGTKFAPPSLSIPKYPGDSVWAHFSSPKPVVTGNPPMVDSGQPMVDDNQLMVDPGQPMVDRMKPMVANGRQMVDAAHQADDWAHRPEDEYAEGVGSNNWAISGTYTASGAPILCNDPHLALTLPSLWFEMQLSAPGINTYGVSLPGAPGIVIGLNDSLSWGLTNNYRDVKDFYEIIDTPVAPFGLTWEGWEGGAYIFCGKARPYIRSIEVIKVKGQLDVIDTVRYTLHGPIMYDSSFLPPGLKPGSSPFRARGGLACTWMGQRGSNELLAVYLLNRARDYNSFTDAISHFECPAQNIAYADRAGNIAMWGQGRFINKWKGQGKYVMEGRDSATLWGQDIPMSENPHVLNPPQGYVASANQSTTDSTYPYWYNGMFFEWRSWEINQLLDRNRDFKFVTYTVDAMKKMQNGVYSEIGHDVNMLLDVSEEELNRVKKIIDPHPFNDNGEMLREDGKVATVFQIFWAQLYKDIWQSKFGNIPGARYPSEERTMQLILADSTSAWYDDPSTPQHETLRNVVQRAFGETTDSLQRLSNAQRPTLKAVQREASNPLEWYNVKNTTVRHLARIPAFSYDHLKIGGWSNTINANTATNGPSWRMIVEMGKDSIRAYGIYPGGQSGNPGSPYYASFLHQWVEGQYNALKFVAASASKNPFRYTWTLRP